MKFPKGKKPQFKVNFVYIAMILMVAMVMMRLVSGPGADSSAPQFKMDYSEFLNRVDKGDAQEVVLQQGDSDSIVAEMKDGKVYDVTKPHNDPYLIGELQKSGVRFSVRNIHPSALGQLFSMLLPPLLIMGLWLWMQNRQAGGGGLRGGQSSIFGMSKSRAKLTDPSANVVTFDDVAGCEEAKEEVREIVDFLRDPKKYEKLGGHAPKGLLLLGDPGTGKTLLARAIAGEAKVPFFATSGSDFVEMFVGMGASRVRDLFAQAKAHAPCIIFIDEIDAVGRKRGGLASGGNDEREQTLNQMLVEMDGFESNSGIIVVGATNRADVLDEALKRPGRLDRHVHVGLPDIRGREAILRVHARKAPLAADVNLAQIARSTPGFSGADLAQVINEGALFAARRNKKAIDQTDIESATDKLLMGPERRSMVLSVDELRVTAYHEAGHALIGELIEELDPLRKVTIMPRGGALGVTISLPERDKISLDKERALADIAMLYGGRIAEDKFIGRVTTGASNDYERATQIATRMVRTWGMSNLGLRVYSDPQGGPFGMGGAERAADVSQATQQRMDDEIERILQEQYQRASDLIEANRDKLIAIAEALLRFETLDAEQVELLMDGATLPEQSALTDEVAERRRKHAELIGERTSRKGRGKKAEQPVLPAPGTQPESADDRSDVEGEPALASGQLHTNV